MYEYQNEAMTTCSESSRNVTYMLLNLVAEVGEFSGKIAKAVRKEQITIQDDNIGLVLNPEFDFDRFSEELKKEAGDILWQLSGLCNVFGWNLEDIARQNLAKLKDRASRGVIIGNGDNR